MGVQSILFWLFGGMAVAGGLMAVLLPRIVHAVFSLLLCFLGVMGVYALAGADFLAVTQLVVYVGGILALILFAVMLTPPDLEERKLPRVLGALAAVGVGVAWISWQVSHLKDALSSAASVVAASTARDRGPCSASAAQAVLKTLTSMSAPFRRWLK